MGCGCGKKRVYIVTTKAGATKQVDSLSAALAVVRAEGGRYQLAKV
jgi:hypothetical protein